MYYPCTLPRQTHTSASGLVVVHVSIPQHKAIYSPSTLLPLASLPLLVKCGEFTILSIDTMHHAKTPKCHKEVEWMFALSLTALEAHIEVLQG